MNHGLIPYVGGKHRLAKRLVELCAVEPANTFIDVFGGSAAVTLAAGDRFGKLIYNDADGDLVNLFRVVSVPDSRARLFRTLRWLPPSRRVFEEDYEQYVAGGFSFHAVADPIERARKTFYRHCFAFGGKVRSGGFAISPGDRERIKEVARYRNTLQKLARVGNLFRQVMIENLHYSELIRIHGRRREAVLFIDPPYFGSEGYYSRTFGAGDHAFLASQLAAVPARVVCTYYDCPQVRALYAGPQWKWIPLQATKNSAFTRGNKVISTETVIIKEAAQERTKI